MINSDRWDAKAYSNSRHSLFLPILYSYDGRYAEELKGDLDEVVKYLTRQKCEIIVLNRLFFRRFSTIISYFFVL